MRDPLLSDPDALERIAHVALERGDLRGFEYALRLLIATDPQRGADLRDTLQAALAVLGILT